MLNFKESIYRLHNPLYATLVTSYCYFLLAFEIGKQIKIMTSFP